MRKITQISNALAGDNIHGIKEVIIALCDDGSLWRMVINDCGDSMGWRQLENIPQ